MEKSYQEWGYFCMEGQNGFTDPMVIPEHFFGVRREGLVVV